MESQNSNHADKICQPLNGKQFQQQPQLPDAQKLMMGPNEASAYTSAPGNDLMQDRFQGKQIQNQIGGGKIRPQSAKTMPTAAEQQAFMQQQ